MFSGRRICITGGAGFIGTNLRRILKNKADFQCELLVVDSMIPAVHGKSYKLPEACQSEDCIFDDVNSRECWARIKQWRPTDIIHLAAETGTGQSMYTPTMHTSANVNGTAVLVEEVQSWEDDLRRNLKIILGSSRAVYGEGEYLCRQCGFEGIPQPRLRQNLERGLFSPVCPACGHEHLHEKPTKEVAPVMPGSIYGWSKLFQERLIALLQRKVKEIVTFRFQNVYGAGQAIRNPYTGVIGVFSTLLSGAQPVRVFEDGLASRDFVHVDDVCCAIVAALEKDLSDLGCPPINIGSGVQTTLLDLAREISNFFGERSGKIEVTGEFRVGDIRHGFADISTAQSRLGYMPKVAFRDGIRGYLEWFLSEIGSEEGLTHNSVISSFHRSMAELETTGNLSRAQTIKN